MSATELPHVLIAFFASSAVAEYAVPLLVAVVAAALAVDRDARLGKALRKQGRAASRMRQGAAKRRLAMARASQTKNIRELAAIVKGQLRACRRRVGHAAYRQSMEFVKETVETLDADRLYRLHRLLLETGGDEAFPGRLDAFFRREIEYSYLGRYRKILFRDHRRQIGGDAAADETASGDGRAQDGTGLGATGT